MEGNQLQSNLKGEGTKDGTQKEGKIKGQYHQIIRSRKKASRKKNLSGDDKQRRRRKRKTARKRKRKRKNTQFEQGKEKGGQSNACFRREKMVLGKENPEVRSHSDMGKETPWVDK